MESVPQRWRTRRGVGLGIMTRAGIQCSNGLGSGLVGHHNGNILLH